MSVLSTDLSVIFLFTYLFVLFAHLPTLSLFVIYLLISIDLFICLYHLLHLQFEVLGSKYKIAKTTQKAKPFKLDTANVSPTISINGLDLIFIAPAC